MTERSFPTKLLHVAVIAMIAIYVVFVQKNRSVVESASQTTKPSHAPHANNCSYQKG